MGVTASSFGEPWRVACPAGHVNLRRSRNAETAFCEQCGRAYDWATLVDRKELTDDTIERRWR